MELSLAYALPCADLGLRHVAQTLLAYTGRGSVGSLFVVTELVSRERCRLLRTPKPCSDPNKLLGDRPVAFQLPGSKTCVL